MATKESMMNFISGSPKEADYVPYVADKDDSPIDTAPKLEILSCPTSINKKLVVISGTLQDDASREPHLFINQKEVNVRGDKWLATVPVNDGINHIVVLAVNNTGKNVFDSRDVFCGVIPPKLEVDDIPDFTSKSVVTISGTVTDINAGASQTPEVSVNGNAVEVGEGGRWTYQMQTADGANVCVITAKNSAQTASVMRGKFFKAPGMPEFCLKNFSESSDTVLPEIKGTLTPAAGGKTCWLRVNEQDVPLAADGTFSTKVKIRQNNNPPVTFTIASDTKYTVQKQLSFDPPAPTNTVLKCEPAQKRILYRIAGFATDANGAISAVSINGKELVVNKGAWSTILTITPGFTPLVIVAKNSFGKTSVLLGCIYLEQAPPELKVTDFPDTVKASEVKLTGTIKDPDGQLNPTVFVNNAVADIKGESWEVTIPLVPGSVNPIQILAKSDTGKTSSFEGEIDCTLVVPSLKVLNCPRETSSPELILRGFARSGFSDSQNDVVVFVNGQKVEFADGKWTHSVTLEKGDNKFVIEAENKDGERVKEQKTVVLL